MKCHVCRKEKETPYLVRILRETKDSYEKEKEILCCEECIQHINFRKFK